MIMRNAGLIWIDPDCAKPCKSIGDARKTRKQHEKTLKRHEKTMPTPPVREGALYNGYSFLLVLVHKKNPSHLAANAFYRP